MVLSRHRHKSELGYLRCFITDTLIDIMVLNTNAYAITRQASPTFVTDAAEMWRFIAARVRMGIVRLPEFRLYWQAEYRDSYVTQLFTRDRFLLLQRYWQIAPPTPAGEKHTVVQKISPLYRDCQAYFAAYYTPGDNFALDRIDGEVPGPDRDQDCDQEQAHLHRIQVLHRWRGRLPAGLRTVPRQGRLRHAAQRHPQDGPWHSSRPILILSTHHQVDQFVTVDHEDNRPAEVKPQVAVDYNYNKGHVDAVDQVKSYYGLERRVQRRWRRRWTGGRRRTCACWGAGGSLGRRRRRQHPLVDVVGAVDQTHTEQTVGHVWMSLVPPCDVVVLMQLGARQEVSEHVVHSAAVAGVDADVVCERDRVDLTQQAGEAAGSRGLPVDDVDICRVVDEEQNAAVPEHGAVRRQGSEHRE